MVEAGLEVDRLGAVPGRVRWWLYLYLERARPQEPRLGVPDNGFRFARGGRADDGQEAQDALRRAWDEARDEWMIWLGQPSHVLAADGRLIPITELDDAIRALEP